MLRYKSLLILALIYLVIFFWQNRGRFLRPYDYSYFGKLYSQSQYIKGSASEGGIGDDGLYAFAGYYYITGGDISRVSFESPPLAKYLIGVSIILFHNELVINLFYAVILLITVYQLGILLTGDRLIAATSAVLTIIDPLFTNQYAFSMLDLPMTLLFLGGLVFYLYGSKQKNPYREFFISALFFALSFTTRFFPILPLLLLILGMNLVKRGRRHWLSFSIFICLVLPLTYIIVHLQYILSHSFMDFLHYQYWIIRWRFGEPFVVGNMLTTILTGYYRSWWQQNLWLRRTDWSLLVPVNFFLGTLSFWRWRKKNPQNSIGMLVLVYIVYCSLATVGVTKFLLPVYPLIIIGSMTTLVLFWGRLAKTWKARKGGEHR